MSEITEEYIREWGNRIFEAIHDISDFEYQQKSWYGLTPNVVSSYIEIVEIPYDCGFEEYLPFYKERNGQDALWALMKELDNMISAHTPADVYNDKAILIDPEWIAICYKAKEVCACWKQVHPTG